jgi:hypothetical protein
MRKKINKIKIVLSIALVFLGIMGFGQTTFDPSKKSIQAWIAIGTPNQTNLNPASCLSQSEFSDGRIINVLHPNYLNLTSSGDIETVLPATDSYGTSCNAFDVSNILAVQSYSSNQFITLSGNDVGLTFLLNSTSKQTNFKNQINNLLVNNNFAGVELDIEKFHNWTSTMWTGYKQLLTELGTLLHSNGKILVVDGPALESQGSSVFSYSDLNAISVIDYVCVMCYSYQHEGAGNPVCPNDWMINSINFIKQQMNNNVNKIIIGMPSYGYFGTGTGTLTNVTSINKIESMTKPGYNTATRHTNSFEMHWTDNGIEYFYSDAIGMSNKIELIRQQGIKHVSVWRLGGNDWFNRFNVDFNNQPIDVNYKLPLFVTGNNWSSTPQYQMDYVKNYDLSNASTINQCAEINKSNLANNQLLLGNYNFGINPSNVINGFDVVVIGHSDPASNQLKSTFSIQLTDGTNYSAIQTFDIYSHHDIIKVFDKLSWGNINWSSNGIDNNFKVILKLVSGETGYINAVFVKAHSSTTAMQTATYDIADPNDDAADAFINNSPIPTYNNGTISGTLYEYHRIGVYKGGTQFANGAYFVNGFRFRNINIPQGVIIQDAKLDLYFNPGTNRTTPNFATFNMEFYCENSLNSHEFTSSTSNIDGTPSRRLLLPNPKVYPFNTLIWSTNDPEGYSSNSPNRLIDVKDIIQPIIANPQWNPNNAGTSSISIIAKLQTTPITYITDQNCVGYSTYEKTNSNAKAAKLSITYQGITPPPSPTISYNQNNGSVIVGNSFNSVVPIIQNMQGTLTFTASPALSNGLGLNSSGQITGIPNSTIANTTTYSITVSNGTQSASCLYTLTIAPLTFTYNPDNGYVSIGDNFISSIPQTNLGGNLTYSCSTLPVGFSISPSNGQITGFTNNPNFTGGQYNVTVENNNNQSLSCIYYLQVYLPHIHYSSNTLTLTKGTFGQSPIPVIKSVSGTRYFSSSPALPIGLSFDNSGKIDGTPLVAVYNNEYTITVTNGTQSTSCSYFIQVNNANDNNCTANYPISVTTLSGSSGNIVTWTGNTYHNGKVIVPYGITLKIIGGVHTFAYNAGIEVKSGAKLIIDGAYLTHECYGHMWDGILLRGDNTKSQTDESSHGIVEIINNGTIAEAYVGITCLDHTQLGIYVPYYLNLGGGIIRAENANFINNEVAVKMYPYQNFNSVIPSSKYFDNSYFRNCKFETNDEYMAPFNSLFFQTFVDLYRIQGINFTSCNFNNKSKNHNKYKGIGIKAIGSKIKVNAKCLSQNLPSGSICPESETVTNEFSGLDYGIYYGGWLLPTDFCNIEDSKFENNYHGVFVSSSTSALIARNTFKVKDILPNNTLCNYGAYLQSCYDFGFEGNKFEGENNTNIPNSGLHVNNSLTTMNTIYNNTFDLFDCATSAIGNNSSLSTNPKKSGLKIKCNDYTNSILNDVNISPSGSSISAYQGYLGSNDAPAGNTFTTELNNQNSNGKFPINNDQGCGFFTYYYHKFNATNKYINPDIPPLSSTSNYNKEEVNGAIYDKQLSCPAKILAPQSPNALQSKITVAQQQLNSAKLMYTIYKDGGNTPALKDAVNLSYPWEAFELYNNLISKSPYLSDEVLIDAIKREDVLPALMLKYILLANPQAVKSREVMEALYRRNNPLPEAWIDELKQGAEIVSPLEQLQAQVSYYAQERQFAYSQLKNIYVTDTSGIYTIDSLITLLVNNNEAISDYELASIYLYQGDSTSFSSIMENIPDKYEYNEKEIDYHNDYVVFFDIMKFLIENNMDFGKLKTEHVDVLNSLYENNRSFASTYALSILMIINPEFEYIEPIYLPVELKMGKPYKKEKLEDNNLLKVFPNPATDYFIVEYNITDAVKGASLEIVDMMNRKLESITISTAKGQTMIKTSDLAKGLYHCYLTNNGKIISQTKITVE